MSLKGNATDAAVAAVPVPHTLSGKEKMADVNILSMNLKRRMRDIGARVSGRSRIVVSCIRLIHLIQKTYQSIAVSAGRRLTNGA